MLGTPDGGTYPALVVGLGNPGRRYAENRHNVGFMTADAVSGLANLVSRARWPGGELCLEEYGGRRFLLLKPETFMNESGRAVAEVLRRYRLAPDRMVVVHDDIDIPLGEVRVKVGGGTAGHRGISSIVDEVGDPGFTRIRIGVGRPPAGVDPADYVLSDFPDEEKELARSSVSRAADRLISLLSGESRV